MKGFLNDLFSEFPLVKNSLFLGIVGVGHDSFSMGKVILNFSNVSFVIFEENFSVLLTDRFFKVAKNCCLIFKSILSISCYVIFMHFTCERITIFESDFGFPFNISISQRTIDSCVLTQDLSFHHFTRN